MSFADWCQARLAEDQTPVPLLSKWEALLAGLVELGSAVTAYSGGVDSSFLAFCAAGALGERMLAVTVASPLDPPSMLASASAFAAQHSIRHAVLAHDPLRSEQFRANPPERCYLCKRDILGLLWEYAHQNGYAVVIEGQNADDALDYRPGRRAVAESGTRSPLAQAGLTKVEIRRLARAFGLAIWDKPATPCLATRLPYGVEITSQRLEQIAKAEEFLHQLGFTAVRVRWHAELARIEVDASQIAALIEQREEIVCYFKQLGFLYTALDLQGYRLGSMNEGLPI